MNQYRFYIDSDSFQHSEMSQIYNYLIDLSWMMSQAVVDIPEEFIHSNCNTLLDGHDKNGLDIAQEFWQSDDRQLQTIYISIEGKIVGCPKEQIISSLETMDKIYEDSHNAFTGSFFYHTTERHITNQAQYLAFKSAHPIDLGSPWSRRHKICPRVIFLNDAESEIEKFPTFWDNVMRRAERLNHFANNYWAGEFSHIKFKDCENLDLADEGNTVKNDPECIRQRLTQIPGQGSMTAFLHFKIGDKRMNVFPDNKNKIFYITYFGKHLKTKRF